MDSPNPPPRILIVDESRMARAMISRQIRELYDFREEGDGEAAWQVLVLDHSIALVICALSLPVLDGDGLLQRVRASKLARLNQMPMLMISGDDDAAMERAKAHGASDFIKRSTVGPELLARIDSLIRLSQVQSQLKENREHNVQNAETGLFTRKYIELQAVQAMSHALRHNSEVSAMVMGFDHMAEIHDEHGAEAVQQLQQRFSTMLAGKIRKEDSLGHFAGSQLVVISPGTPYAACESFGNRLREAIHVANIAIHGHRLNLTVSVGVSNSPTDGVTSAGGLIELAGARLKQAQQAGGNRVIACDFGKTAKPSRAPRLDHTLALLKAGHESDVVPHIAVLGSRILPLLRLLEREMRFGLPLGELERRLGAGGEDLPPDVD